MTATAYLSVLCLIVVLSVISSIYVWIRHPIPGSKLVSLLATGGAIWVLGYVLELATNDLVGKQWMNRAQYIGITMVSTAWLAFALLYTRREKWLVRPRWLWLLIEPSLMLILVFSNDWHHLIWKPATLSPSGPFTVLVHQHGIGYWVHAAYSYTIHIVVIAFFVQMLTRSPQLYRRQVLMLLVASALPFVSNLVIQFGLNPAPFVDLTPLSFVIASQMLIWGMFWLRSDDIIPVARAVVLESIGDGLIVLDEQNRIIDVNAAARQVVKTHRSSAWGQRLDLLSPVWADLLRRADEESSDQSDEIELEQDGVLHVWETRISELIDWRRRALGRAIVLRNVTERRQREQEQQALQASQERARRLESLNMLTTSLAHNLNNILSPLVGYPELIMYSLPSDSPIQDDLMQIEYAAQKAARIVHELLTLTEHTCEMAVLDLNQVVEKYMRSSVCQEILVQHPNVQVETLLDNDLNHINGYLPHLNRVLTNLITNALESMSDSGRLTLITRNEQMARPQVGYEQIPAGQYVVLEIGDTGHGMAEQDTEHLFEPFYSKKGLSSQVVGLGLAIVHSIVQNHQGYIDVQTQPGQGTRMIMYFPATQGQASDPLCDWFQDDDL